MEITRDLFIESILRFWVCDTKQWKKAALAYCDCLECLYHNSKA